MLNDNLIATQASLLTIEILKAQGLTESDYKYYSIENTLFEASKNNQHVITVGWPDGVYCFFSSSEPLTLDNLFNPLLITAYHNSLSQNKHDNWLG